jgi:phage terminase large subunit
MCLSQASVEEGIKAARLLFPRCYFDKDKTERLMECLKRYRRAIHTQTGEPMGPLHDEYSHGADMFRYVGQAVELMRNDQEPDYDEAEAPDWRL